MPAIVDLIQQATELYIAWTTEPGHARRPVDATLIHQLTDELAEAERFHPQRVNALRIALGRLLFDTLDGPERALAQRLNKLHLIVRLVGAPNPAEHPAARWRFELLADERGPLFTHRDRRLRVQLGSDQPAEPTVIDTGRLRILFMAFSPEDMKPVLDYEYEEDRLLQDLLPFIEQDRATVHVVEDGTLAELERRLKLGRYDIVHLTGHGLITPQGPRLAMENDLGTRDLVAPESLLRVLERSEALPRLLMVASCHSADGDAGVPSLAASLVAGGLPAVLGWVRPIGDLTATLSARDLYDRLCTGATLDEAVAFTRRKLAEGEGDRRPSPAWATLHLVGGPEAAFRLDPTVEPTPEPAPDRATTYRFLGGQMEVKGDGFVGRRRPLQTLIRVLRTGQHDGLPRAGAKVLGLKGVGKSCLVGRAFDRYRPEVPNAGLVILHGALDELTLLQHFEQQAQQWEDPKAEAILKNPQEGAVARIVRLLRGPWARRKLVVILDDFEHNLELRPEGSARLTPGAAALLTALLPLARGGQVRVLITSTADFELPAAERDALVPIRLARFETAEVRKLWMRGRADLRGVPPDQWLTLADRLGRNPRVLDWARTLLGGRTPREVEEVVKRAGLALPEWKDGLVPDEAEQDKLAAAFLATLAFSTLGVAVSDDARTFLRRARVYEVPVPIEAFAGFTEGLELDLEKHLPALADLGLLERGSLHGRDAWGVSSLLEPEFKAEEPAKWHGLAAVFWEKEMEKNYEHLMAWRHALKAGDEDRAGRLGIGISVRLFQLGLYYINLNLARAHNTLLPNDPRSLRWLGHAHTSAGEPNRGAALLEQAIAAAGEGLQGELHAFYDDLSRAYQAAGDLPRAQSAAEEALARAKVGTDPMVEANMLHLLAQIQGLRGDLPGARSNLEQSLLLTEDVANPNSGGDRSATLHELARVLIAQGDLGSAWDRLQESWALKMEVLGADPHPDTAATLHEMSVVRRAQGDWKSALGYLEQCLAMEVQVFDPQSHPSVATTRHSISQLLLDAGDLDGAQEQLEQSLAIRIAAFGQGPHHEVANSLLGLAQVLFAKGDLKGARTHLMQCRAMQSKVYPNEFHPMVASSYAALGELLKKEGKRREAVVAFVRSLAIRDKVFGTREHHESAETEISYGILLVELGRIKQGIGLLRHAQQFLQENAPTHPAVAFLEWWFEGERRETL